MTVWGWFPEVFLFLSLASDGFLSQCLRDPEKLSIMGLNPGKLDRPDRLQDNFEPCFINMLKVRIWFRLSKFFDQFYVVYSAFVFDCNLGIVAKQTINFQKLFVEFSRLQMKSVSF